MASGLYDHIPCKAQMIAQREKLLLACIAGRVFTLWCIGKFSAGAKHMAMRINCACGQLKTWLGRAFEPIKPACGFREIT